MKICPVGATWTNRHDEANRCLLQFCECT